jgi:hypothetical protein
MGQWLDTINADGSSRSLAQKVIADRPGDAVDACWIGGTRVNDPAVIGSGGPCETQYPPHSLPRMVAGMPIDSLVAKCQLAPISASDYGSPSPAQLTRLQQIFPNGVCDYSKPGVGEQGLSGTWQSFGPAQNVVARHRSLKLAAKRVRTRAGSRIRLTARLRPCPEVTWQRVTFERGRKRVKSAIVDGKKCTAQIQVKSAKGIRAVAKPITGYAQARSKRV